MILRIYQLDIETAHGLIFEDWSRISNIFDFNRYHQVYEDVNFRHINNLTGESYNESISDLLEYIFSLFNIASKPESYVGHSLSISDIVELDGVRYYVDGIGFKKIS